MTGLPSCLPGLALCSGRNLSVCLPRRFVGQELEGGLLSPGARCSTTCDHGWMRSGLDESQLCFLSAGRQGGCSLSFGPCVWRKARWSQTIISGGRYLLREKPAASCASLCKVTALSSQACSELIPAPLRVQTFKQLGNAAPLWAEDEISPS